MAGIMSDILRDRVLDRESRDARRVSERLQRSGRVTRERVPRTYGGSKAPISVVRERREVTRDGVTASGPETYDASTIRSESPRPTRASSGRDNTRDGVGGRLTDLRDNRKFLQNEVTPEKPTPSAPAKPAKRKQASAARMEGESYEEYKDRTIDTGMSVDDFIEGLRSEDMPSLREDKEIVDTILGSINFTDPSNKFKKEIAGFNEKILDDPNAPLHQKLYFLKRAFDMDAKKPYMTDEAYRKEFGLPEPAPAAPVAAEAQPIRRHRPSADPANMSAWERLNYENMNSLTQRIMDSQLEPQYYGRFPFGQGAQRTDPFSASGVPASPVNQALRAMLMQGGGYYNTGIRKPRVTRSAGW